MTAVKEVKRVKVLSENIQRGMYVAGLDRPWSDSPFLLQGFVVSSDKVLAKLQQLCEFVYVDTSKSIHVKGKSKAAPSTIESLRKHSSSSKDPYRASLNPLPINKERYKPKASMTHAEMKLAKESYKEVQRSLGNLLDGVTKNSAADPKEVDDASGILVSSAVSFPSSLSWLALIQKHSNRVYDHALRASTWALLCGRHIGLSESDLKWLAIGTMLKDVGQLRKAVMNKEGKSSEKYIDLSISLAKLSKLHPKVIGVIASHRERFNGTGKPKGLEGEEIPLLARISAIATAYDMALNPIRKDREEMSPSQAAKMIYTQRGRAFQDELAIQFIEALGTYPLGTILQLDTGEVAVVVDQDQKHRLKPRIIIVTDEAGQPIEKKRLANLGEPQQGSEGEHLNAKVMRDLTFSAINLNMAELLEEYEKLQKAEQRKVAPLGFMKRLFKRQKT